MQLKLKTITFLCFFIMWAHNALADWAMVYGTENDQDTIWEYFWMAGDRAHDVMETSDGDFIFTGQFALNRDDDNRRSFWVCKTDRHGGMIWQKHLGFGIGVSIAPGNEGNVVIAGTALGSVSGPWTGKLRLVKIDPQGNVLWDKNYGHPIPESRIPPISPYPYPEKIIPTSDGGYFVAGSAPMYSDTSDASYYSSEFQDYHLWVIKVDSDGDLEWENAYTNTGYSFFDCRQTDDGGYIVVGAEETNPYSGSLLKLDSEGTMEWGKVFSNVRGQAVEVALDGEGTADGYVTAAVDSLGNWVIIKLSTDGSDILWQKTYDFQGQPMSISRSSDDNFIVAGLTTQYGSGTSDGVIMKIDTQGNPMWARAYGGLNGGNIYQTEYLHAVRETADGGLVAAGFTRSLGFGDGNANTDALILKTNSQGELSTSSIDTAIAPTVGEGAVDRVDFTATAFDYAPQIYRNANPAYYNSHAESLIICRAEANLEFRQQADTPDPVGVGEMVTYTIVLENTGPQDATGVTLSGSASSGEALYVGWIGDVTIDGLNYTINLGDLAVGDTETFSIVVETSEAGIMENRAMVRADQYDSWPDDNETWEDTTVEQPGLSVSIQDSPDPVGLGMGLAYTVTVSNYSEIDATGVVLTDTLPVGFEPLVYVCSMGDAATLAGGVVTCHIGNLPAGERATLSLGGTVTSETAATLVNTAEIIADGVAPLPQHAAVEETSVQYPDLAVEISDWSDPVRVGYYLIYTVAVSNLSPFQAHDVVMTDTLPPNTELVSCATTQGDCTPGSGMVTAEFGEINGGENASMTLVVRTLSEGTLVNTAEVTNALGNDNNPVDNSYSETTEITTWTKTDLGQFNGAERRKVSLDADSSGNLYAAFIQGDGHLIVADTTSGDWRFTTFSGFITEAALTLDTDGVAHMVYCLMTRHPVYTTICHWDIYYVYNAGGQWSQPKQVNVEGMNDELVESLQISVKLQPEKLVYISCIGHYVFDSLESHLWYFKSHPEAASGFVEYWRPAMWSIAMAVDDGVNDHGAPHFSYFSDNILNDGSGTFGIGYFTQRDANGAEVVDTGWGCAQCDGGYVTDIVLDTQYNPHIVYAGQENQAGYEHYWYAVKNGDTWERTRLADGYSYSGGCAIDLDASDGVHTVVYDVSESNGKIAYVAKKAGMWETTTIYARDNGRIPLLDPTIVVDSSQTVHIAFLDDNSHLQIHSNSLSGDTDLDSVPDIEEMGPDGDDPLFDGNQDGLPDYQQPHVASMKTWNSSGYVTLAVPDHVILSDVRAMDNPSLPDCPTEPDFSLGWFSFNLLGLSKGEAVAVQMYLPEEATPLSYYKYGPTEDNSQNHWYAFDYDENTETGVVIAGHVITLNFVDGQRGDGTLAADGIITDPGGPAVVMVSEPDFDGDGVSDDDDAFPQDPTEWSDADGDDIGDNADPDDDNDGILDSVEKSSCTNPLDSDSDDDGIVDGVEDTNHDGKVDSGETDPCIADTDGDGIQDGTELGISLNDIGPDTDTNVFVPDADPLTFTDPLNDDTDYDGFKDGIEDKNHNGAVDGNEADPNDATSKPELSMPWIPLLLE